MSKSQNVIKRGAVLNESEGFLSNAWEAVTSPYTHYILQLMLLWQITY